MHDDFFQGTGPGAPSFQFGNIGDTVWGEIVDISKSQSTAYSTNPQAPKVGETNDDGSPRMQLRLILQTQLRGWQGVSKVPTNEQGQPKAPQEDDGKRAVFIKENTNLQYRFGDALAAAGANGQRASLETGALLSVKFASTRPSTQGNDAKQYEVHYKPAPPRSPADGFFGNQQNQPPANQQTYPAAQPQFQQPGAVQQQPIQQGPPPQQPYAQQPVWNQPQGQPQYQQAPPQQPQQQGPPPGQQQDPWAVPQGQAPQQQFAQQPQQQGPPPQDPWAQSGPANGYTDQPPF